MRPALWLLLVLGAGCTSAPIAPVWSPPTSKALRYLREQVPRWRQEHRCFSCHHHGDGARALYLARSLGDRSALDALVDTTRFLESVASWDANGIDAPYSDKVLARVQFAGALQAAIAAGASDPRTLRGAASLLAESQHASGSWDVDSSAVVGSPVTYGAHLATARAVVVLRRAAAESEARQRAEGWLRAQPIRNVPEAAAVVLALRDAEDAEAHVQTERGVALLLSAQRPEGGWGPFVDAAAEPFDTAIAMLALQALTARAGVAAAIAKGRRFLAITQAPDGSWIETTRPRGYESLAQRLSTAGWATQALLLSETPAPRTGH